MLDRNCRPRRIEASGISDLRPRKSELRRNLASSVAFAPHADLTNAQWRARSRCCPVGRWWDARRIGRGAKSSTLVADAGRDAVADVPGKTGPGRRCMDCSIDGSLLGVGDHRDLVASGGGRRGWCDRPTGSRGSHLVVTEKSVAGSVFCRMWRRSPCVRVVTRQLPRNQ